MNHLKKGAISCRKFLSSLIWAGLLKLLGWILLTACSKITPNEFRKYTPSIPYTHPILA